MRSHAGGKIIIAPIKLLRSFVRSPLVIGAAGALNHARRLMNTCTYIYTERVNAAFSRSETTTTASASRSLSRDIYEEI